MKVGDLVCVIDTDGTCGSSADRFGYCGCWFCHNNSSRQGIILEKLSCGLGAGYWLVLFDAGEWRLYGTEIELLSES